MKHREIINFGAINMGRIVAIDYGTKRTGIAVTDPEKIIATGLTTVRSHELISYLEKYIGTRAGKIPEKKKEPSPVPRPTDPVAILPGEKTLNKNRPVFLNNS